MKENAKALLRQRQLLQLEYEEERKNFKEITNRIGVETLAARGKALLSLRAGCSYTNSINQRILELHRTLGDDEEINNDHYFEPGTPVMLLNFTDNELPKELFPSTVSIIDGQRIALVIPDNASTVDLDKATDLGIVMAFDETSFQAMFRALEKVINADGRLGELRNLIYSNAKANEYTFGDISTDYLNKSQSRGINKILHAKDVAVVHGPPGTGKTTTLVEAIYQTLRREPQVLVTAQSNMALDWICEKLTDRGVSVMRIGNPKRVTDKMLSFTYERLFADHPEYPNLWQVRRDMNLLRSSRSSVRDFSHKMGRLRSRAVELESRINADLFDNAKVIAATLVGCENKILAGRRFPTVFIDEAAQALEAACWIAIRKAGRVVLAGDHCQLPATVKCYEAQKQGLGVSLMERIVANHPECVTLLETQYRMHKDIMQFPNHVFYHGRMRAAENVAHRSLSSDDPAIEWLDTADIIAEQEVDEIGANSVEQSKDMETEVGAPGATSAKKSRHREIEIGDNKAFEESEIGHNGGRINRDEALLCLLALTNYIKRIGVKKVTEERVDFAIISPYRAQVQYMRSLIKKIPELRKLCRQISIDTVDGFQGQERDVVIISTVRSNDRGNIGFLSDIRRMNVAITRARMKVIIIGDSTTLSHHPFYRRLHSYVALVDSRQ